MSDDERSWIEQVQIQIRYKLKPVTRLTLILEHIDQSNDGTF